MTRRAAARRRPDSRSGRLGNLAGEQRHRRRSGAARPVLPEGVVYVAERGPAALRTMAVIGWPSLYLAVRDGRESRVRGARRCGVSETNLRNPAPKRNREDARGSAIGLPAEIESPGPPWHRRD